MQLFEVKQSDLTSKVLSDRFLVPPFSVFNTHQPYFKKRMQYWREIGVCNQEGRDTNICYDNRRMDKRRANNLNGTSVFNPVLTEVVYRWFTIANSTILDPFAGGITRGAIASILGHNYTGYDISKRQVESNYKLYEELEEKYKIGGSVKWINEDAINIETENYADLVFTCPPYFNLEKYTDLDNDLSNMPTYDSFRMAYSLILSRCVHALKDDSFFVIVVSDIRDKKTTEYYGFVADTIKQLQTFGLHYYNEIILYNETGNLAITSGDYINKARKVGRQHQNVLVFYKGDIKNIKDKFVELG